MCGIVGIASDDVIVGELYESLIQLQHRGQEASGIVTASHNRFFKKHAIGLVRESMKLEDLQSMQGCYGIGHTRYSTAGISHDLEEAQPLLLSHPYGIALAHNGNLTNCDELAEKLKSSKRHLNTFSDSEIILHLFAESLDVDKLPQNSAEFFEQLCLALNTVYSQVKGSFSIVCLIMGKGMIAFRDPNGVRPLVAGERTSESGKPEYIFASENTMFYPLGFKQVDDVQPGELVYVDSDGEVFRKTLATAKKFTPCVFEYVYFARPDAKINDVSVYRARLRLGQNLARRWKEQYPDVKPDVVIPAPFTSNTAASSFAHELDVRYTEGLYKNPFIGRSFILPGQEQRKRTIRYKLVPQELEIRDKKVLILDDSIVRGTTSKEIVKMVRETGAKEVYFVTTCPPVKSPCFYGIDIPTRNELIANKGSLDDVRKYLDVDKLLYQEQDDLVEAIARRGKHHIDSPCMACLNGKYPIGNIDDTYIKNAEKKRLGAKEGE